MKRLMLILLLSFCLFPVVQAQKGLHIGEFFNRKFAKATLVQVEGRELKPYHLTLYRSFSIGETENVADRMEQCVMADARLAYSKETGELGERLYYAFLALPPREGQQANRYIFYRNVSLRQGGKDELTLVYMEGSVTMDELKKLFKK